MTTNFFTAANFQYEMFIPIYACSVLLNNPDATVEVVVEDDEALARNSRISLMLRGLFSDRFHMRTGNFQGVTPNIVRFLEEPELRSKYTYIGDIDIVVLEHITPWHLKKMSFLGLPHSNIIRSGQERMTGLHFCETEFHYPVDSSVYNVHAKASATDEKFLYKLYEARCSLPRADHTSRPLHGLHVSLNRCPYDKKGWGLNSVFFESYFDFLASHEWSKVKECCSDRTLWVVELLTLSVKAKSVFSDSELERIRPMGRPPKEQKILDEYYRAG